MIKFKQEYGYQLVALCVYLLSLLFSIHHNELEFSGRPFNYLGLALYHGLLFLVVNYVLIPKFFSKKKMLLFILTLVIAIGVFAFVEETVIEYFLFPSRAFDDFDIFDVYFFIGEVGIPLLVFMIIKLHFERIKNQKRIAQVEKTSLQSELKFLRSQIQPHVLFNSLNNLYEYTRAKSDKAPELVLQLSNVLRYVLYESDTERISIEKELQFLKEYIALQETQLESRGKVDFKIVKENTDDSYLIAPFMLIPFIENSFKHSANSKENNIYIKIEIKMNGQDLELLVINTYEEHPKTSQDLMESGIGLTNVKKRLDLIYPNNHTLQTTENTETYEVRLQLNLAE